MGIKMKRIVGVLFFVFVFVQFGHAQNAKPVFSFCGKTGDVTMTWDEFMACKKELVTVDKNASISSFILTIKKAGKKDYEFVEFPAKGNTFTKGAMDTIEKLHKEKKLGDKLEITNVEVVQSGKAAKQVPGMVITLN